MREHDISPHEEKRSHVFTGSLWDAFRTYANGTRSERKWSAFRTQMERVQNANGARLERKWSAFGTQMERVRNANGTRSERKGSANAVLGYF